MTKSHLIAGLIAAQGLFAVNASAQTHLFKVGNSDTKLRVADHIGGEELSGPTPENTLEAYNLDISGKRFTGLISFESPANNIVFASHHFLPNTSDYLSLLKGYEPFISGPNGANIVAQRLNDKDDVQSAVLLHYDETGKIIKPVELPFLPSGFSFIRVLDVIEYINISQGPQRILCLLKDPNGNPMIAELLYWAPTGKYVVRMYKTEKPPKSYLSVHYVRAYHYGRTSIGNPAFYGMSDDGNTISAFCYYEEVPPGITAFEHYDLVSVNGKKGVSGVQMTGDYGPNGIVNRIEMAFTDEEGGICIQQKDALGSPNWQRFYQLADKAEFRLAFGRDGGATKMGPGINPNVGYEKGYFLGAQWPSGNPDKAQVAALHYDGTTGALKQTRLYNIPGKGVLEDGGFPSTSYDPGGMNLSGKYVDNYTFIADRQKDENTFRRGTGNSMIETNDKYFCSEPYKVEEASDKRLNTIKDAFHPAVSDTFYVKPIEIEQYNDIQVSVIEECSREKEQAKGAGIQDQIQPIAELAMDAAKLRVSATDKAIAAVQIFAIDGRVLVQESNLATNRYEHAFSSLLVPGIYVVRITYTDHSTEARKVSVR